MAARIAAVQNSGVARAASAPRVTKSRRLIRSIDMVMKPQFPLNGCPNESAMLHVGTIFVKNSADRRFGFALLVFGRLEGFRRCCTPRPERRSAGPQLADLAARTAAR